MYQLVIWFNIITFTLMFVAISFNYISYKRKKLSWKYYYLRYESSYAVWFLTSTYGAFNALYLENPPAQMALGMALIRAMFYVVHLGHRAHQLQRFPELRNTT